ncbi:unnamed protein product [Gadus morhua 'NCC']
MGEASCILIPQLAYSILALKETHISLCAPSHVHPAKKYERAAIRRCLDLRCTTWRVYTFNRAMTWKGPPPAGSTLLIWTQAGASVCFRSQFSTKPPIQTN